LVSPGEEDAKRMTEPHTGTLTFLFTDVEGSTFLWERNPKAMSEALVRHEEILRTAIEAYDGYVFKTVGDAFYAAFPTAPKAVSAALDAQRALHHAEWEETGPLRVRMALHTGAAEGIMRKRRGSMRKRWPYPGS
jgi:class 3 adenylate cyclase